MEQDYLVAHSSGLSWTGTQTYCQVGGYHAWQVPYSNIEIPKSYEILAFSLTPTVIQVTSELRLSHLRV